MGNFYTINRLMFNGPVEEIERLKQFGNGEGAWIVQPFTYEIGYDGYYRSGCFTSSMRVCQIDSVGEDLHHLSAAFPNIRFIYTHYTDYPEGPLEIYFTDVYEAGKRYHIGGGSMTEFDSVESVYRSFGLNLDLQLEKIAKELIFNGKLYEIGNNCNNPFLLQSYVYEISKYLTDSVHKEEDSYNPRS